MITYDEVVIVKLDGKKVGEIRKLKPVEFEPNRYAYFPKGSNHGDVFGSIEAVKQSLETDYEVEEKEKMDLHTAVFNQHVNDAGNRTKAHMKEFYPRQLERVEKLEIEYNSIMGIFEVKPEIATIVYCTLVAYFVNQ